MSSPRSISTGGDSAGARVEYVKSRRVVRLSGNGEAASPIELPVEGFLERLGIDGADLAEGSLYLLFAGASPHPRGGSSDLVGGYRCPDAARQAFRRLRERRGVAWGELVELDVLGRTRPLSWFGPSGRPEPRVQAVGPEVVPPPEPRAESEPRRETIGWQRWRRRS